MGSKNKLKRFRENESFPNVIQPTRDEALNEFEWKGKWEEFFKNSNPIVLELGCGKGEYSVGLAKRNPNKNDQMNDKNMTEEIFILIEAQKTECSLSY